MNGAVADVMHPVAPVGLHASYREIVRSLGDQRISALPIIDEHGRVLGVVSEADLLRIRTRDKAVGHFAPPRDRRRVRSDNAGHPVTPTAQTLMSSPAIVTTGSTPVAEAITKLTAAGIRQLPVVDTDGRLVGYVSRADLVRAELLRSDAQIREDIIGQVISTWMSVDPATVDVDVQDGIVKLIGQLETAAVLGQLVHLVAQVPGVVGIDDRLSVEPRAHTRQ